jgi:acetyl esterase/lipase
MTYAIDPELLPWLDMLPGVRLMDEGTLAAARTQLGELTGIQPPYEPTRPVDVRDTTVPGPAGAPAVPVRVYRPAGVTGELPGLLNIHGGGFVLGDIEMTHTDCLRTAAEVGLVVVSVDYRLAPEHPFPAPVEDCYAALRWLAAEAGELGVDLTRLGVAGESAGGGLAAGVALLARDRGGPALAFQYLGIPEVDDRLETPSMRAYTDTPLWNLPNAVFSWKAYLGADHEGDVSPYAAPARAEDLSGLPPAYVTVCHFDPLRDEGIAYAQRLAQAGVATELHLYPGTFHGSELVAAARISRRMQADGLAALRAGLHVDTAVVQA